MGNPTMSRETAASIGFLIVVATLTTVVALAQPGTPANNADFKATPFKWFIYESHILPDRVLRFEFEDDRDYEFIYKHISSVKVMPKTHATALGLPSAYVEIVCGGKETRIDIASDDEGRALLKAISLVDGQKVIASSEDYQ